MLNVKVFIGDKLVPDEQLKNYTVNCPAVDRIINSVALPSMKENKSKLAG